MTAFPEKVDASLPVNGARAAWPSADGWWSVVPEIPGAQGRLDILLTNRGPSGPATIVIENKWGHGLGDLQLERYADYLLMQKPLGEAHRKCLVYLTPSGEAPRIQVPVDFAPLSHSLHIAELLRDTLESCGTLSRQPCASLCCSTARYWMMTMPVLDPSVFDRGPRHEDSWPYYHGIPAAEVNALQIDTDEFATVLSKLLPLPRRAVEQIG